MVRELTADCVNVTLISPSCYLRLLDELLHPHAGNDQAFICLWRDIDARTAFRHAKSPLASNKLWSQPQHSRARVTRPSCTGTSVTSTDRAN
jgi:hypothetical protein